MVALALRQTRTNDLALHHELEELQCHRRGVSVERVRIDMTSTMQRLIGPKEEVAAQLVQARAKVLGCEQARPSTGRHQQGRRNRIRQQQQFSYNLLQQSQQPLQTRSLWPRRRLGLGLPTRPNLFRSVWDRGLKALPLAPPPLR